MDTLTSSAAELCKAEISALYLREGDVLVARGVAHADADTGRFPAPTPLQIDNSTYLVEPFQAAAVRNIADVATETETGQLKRFGEILGFRSIVFVSPDAGIQQRWYIRACRMRPVQFSASSEVELVQTFADQAVIASKMSGCSRRSRQRTREPHEVAGAADCDLGSSCRSSALAGRTAAGFSKYAGERNRLCEAEFGVMWLCENDDFRSVAIHGPLPPAYVEQCEELYPVHPNPPQPLTILAQTRKTVHVPDMREDRFICRPSLQFISQSPGDLEPVFEKMLANATRALQPEFGSMNSRTARCGRSHSISARRICRRSGDRASFADEGPRSVEPAGRSGPPARNRGISPAATPGGCTVDLGGARTVAACRC